MKEVLIWLVIPWAEAPWPTWSPAAFHRVPTVGCGSVSKAGSFFELQFSIATLFYIELYDNLAGSLLEKKAFLCVQGEGSSKLPSATYKVCSALCSVCLH